MIATRFLWPLALLASIAFASELFQEQSISNVTRRSGGATYQVVLNQPVNNLYVTLTAELVDPSSSSHKLQIYNVSYVTMGGNHVTMAGEQFLTGSNAKLTLEANSNDPINKVLIRAESWRAYHGMYVSVEGSQSRVEPTQPTQPDYPNYPTDPTPPQVDPNDEAARIEAERRRIELERQREIERQVAIRVEEERQRQCRGDLIGRVGSPGIQSQADQCFSSEVPEANRRVDRTNRRLIRVRRQLTELNKPIIRCNENLNDVKKQVASLTRTYNSKSASLDAVKAQTSEKLNLVRAAADQGEKYRCTLSKVGKKRRGTYRGEGESKAKAVMAAFMNCPNRKNDGCGDQDEFRGTVNCQKLK